MTRRDPLNPKVVISVDLELRWGRHHRLGLDRDAYRANIEGGRTAVPAVLEALVSRDLHATWAIVGAVVCNGWHDYFSRAPIPPAYHTHSLAVKPEYAEMDPNGTLHFAPELAHRVFAAPGQELGTHTFSHIFLREPGVEAHNFRDDLRAVQRLYQEKFGSVATSLVFPRNQHTFIDVARLEGITIWRGNEVPWYYDCNTLEANRLHARAFRFLDAVNPWARRASPIEPDMTRSSMFIRFNLPDAMWVLHLARLQRELRMLGPGEVFHAWFHEHNLGVATRKCMSRLEQVLDNIATACVARRIRSCSMRELSVNGFATE